MRGKNPIPRRCNGIGGIVVGGTINRIQGRHWGYAYVNPRSEKRVEQALSALGIPIYLPTVPRARMHHSTRVVTYHPMLPGYIFLSLTDEERRELKIREKHIVQIELLRDEQQENEFISELNILKQCEILARSTPVVINPEIVRGDSVEVVSGPLKGLQTTVADRAADSDTVIINLTLLNMHVSCRIAAECLRKTEK